MSENKFNNRSQEKNQSASKNVVKKYYLLINWKITLNKRKPE